MCVFIFFTEKLLCVLCFKYYNGRMGIGFVIY